MSVLAGKVAIVTGASAGIGWATGVELARMGAVVVAQARRNDRLLDLVRTIEAAGGRALAVPGDAGSAADVATLVKATEAFGKKCGCANRLDIVVVNAGRGLAGGLLTSDEKQWEELYRVNVMGAAILMRAAGQIMVEQQSGDVIVLGSVAGRNISPFSGFYGSSKFAISGMAEAFRREVCSKKVRVTTILPGVVISEFQQVAGYTRDNFYRNIERFDKVLAPEDVARAIGFVVGQPAHVHINELMIRPTMQDQP